MRANFEFIVGIATGKILFGAFLVSPFVRNIALATGAISIATLYVQNRVPGLLDAAHRLVEDFSIKPDFTKRSA